MLAVLCAVLCRTGEGQTGQQLEVAAGVATEDSLQSVLPFPWLSFPILCVTLCSLGWP